METIFEFYNPDYDKSFIMRRQPNTKGGVVCKMPDDSFEESRKEWAENVAIIIKAVNNHHKLMELLRYGCDNLTSNTVKARAWKEKTEALLIKIETGE